MNETLHNVAEFISTETEERPWGRFRVILKEGDKLIKLLFVKKNQALSMQYHMRRDQQYYLLDDDFEVEFSTEPVPADIAQKRDKALAFVIRHYHMVSFAKKGDEFYFPRRVMHRICYRGNKEYGTYLEVSRGSYDERDIIRLRDMYGRGFQKG